MLSNNKTTSRVITIRLIIYSSKKKYIAFENTCQYGAEDNTSMKLPLDGDTTVRRIPRRCLLRSYKVGSSNPFHNNLQSSNEFDLKVTFLMQNLHFNLYDFSKCS